VLQHKGSGVIARGATFAEDKDRPGKILGLVRELFQPLGGDVTIKLGDGAGSDRFLKADFAWGSDPDIGGVSAQGLGRTRLGPFNRRSTDQNKPVTGYVFEGVIGGWIMDILGPVKVSLNNIFATFICHELGHQLGLGHESGPDNIMFVWADMGLAERQTYLRLANDVKLRFTEAQVKVMRETIAKP
jgi:hypothetical protein